MSIIHRYKEWKKASDTQKYREILINYMEVEGECLAPSGKYQNALEAYNAIVRDSNAQNSSSPSLEKFESMRYKMMPLGKVLGACADELYAYKSKFEKVRDKYVRKYGSLPSLRGLEWLGSEYVKQHEISPAESTQPVLTDLPSMAPPTPTPYTQKLDEYEKQKQAGNLQMVKKIVRNPGKPERGIEAYDEEMEFSEMPPRPVLSRPEKQEGVIYFGSLDKLYSYNPKTRETKPVIEQ